MLAFIYNLKKKFCYKMASELRDRKHAKAPTEKKKTEEKKDKVLDGSGDATNKETTSQQVQEKTSKRKSKLKVCLSFSLLSFC